MKNFYEPEKFALNLFKFFLDLTNCIAKLKFFYMLCGDLVYFFDGNEKMHPRKRLAGANFEADTYFFHVFITTQNSYLVENLIVAIA